MDGAMQWADLGAASIRYEYRPGPGPLLVLIHELGGSLENWDHVIQALESDCAVLRYDTRGAGLSEKITAPISMAHCADDIAALVDHLGYTGPLVVAGCAVGAGIALRFAIDYPDMASAVVAINPAIDVTPISGAALEQMADQLPVDGVRALEGAALGKPYPDRFRDRDPDRFADFRARWLSNDPVSLGWLCRMLANTDLRPKLPTIECPVTLVSGLHDTLRPPAYVREIAALIDQASLVEIDAGHHAPDHAPEALAQSLQATISELNDGQTGYQRRANR